MSAYSINSSQYLPGTRQLDQTQHEFRLFKLRGDVLELDLAIFRLQDCPSYIALSYVWGSQSSCTFVYINSGPRVSITRNLWDFLLVLRANRAYENTWFWADQICINQRITRERNHQVGLMGRIYSAADEVFAYLGSEPACLNADIRILSSSIDSWSRWLIGKEQQFGRISDVDEALLDILTRPYWTRLWVVQELQLAKKVVFWCGPIAMVHEFLVDYSEELRYRGVAQVDPMLRPKYRLFTQQFQKLVTAMLCHRMAWLPPESQVGLLSLDEVLRKYADCSCFDPRDKVFGLQELVRREDRILVDYSLTFAELAKHVRNAICRSVVRAEVRLYTNRYPRQIAERWLDERAEEIQRRIAKIPIIDRNTTNLSYQHVAIVSWAYYVSHLFEYSQLCSWIHDPRPPREGWWNYAVNGCTTLRQKFFIEDLYSIVELVRPSWALEQIDLENVSRSLLEEVAVKHGFVLHNGFILHPSEWIVLGEHLRDHRSSVRN